MLRTFNYFILPIGRRPVLFLLFLLLPVGLCAQRASTARPQQRTSPYGTQQVGVNGQRRQQEDPAASRKKEKKPKQEYPLVNGLMVGVDLFEPVSMLFGQSYGGYEASVELDLKNRFFPIWEFGIGRANNTPEDMNFTYVGKPALYNRIGMNYNFTYGGKSPNFFTAGFRYGFSSFKYDIEDITIRSNYWGEEFHEQILNQQSSAHWLELVAGIRVKIVAGFFMGWSFRYKFLLSQKKNVQSNPWYIPGYGPETGSVGLTYSIYYKLPLKSKLKKKSATLRKVVEMGGK